MGGGASSQLSDSNTEGRRRRSLHVLRAGAGQGAGQGLFVLPPLPKATSLPSGPHSPTMAFLLDDQFDEIGGDGGADAFQPAVSGGGPSCLSYTAECRSDIALCAAVPLQSLQASCLTHIFLPDLTCLTCLRPLRRFRPVECRASRSALTLTSLGPSSHSQNSNGLSPSWTDLVVSGPRSRSVEPLEPHEEPPSNNPPQIPPTFLEPGVSRKGPITWGDRVGLSLTATAGTSVQRERRPSIAQRLQEGEGRRASLADGVSAHTPPGATASSGGISGGEPAVLSSAAERLSRAASRLHLASADGSESGGSGEGIFARASSANRAGSGAKWIAGGLPQQSSSGGARLHAAAAAAPPEARGGATAAAAAAATAAGTRAAGSYVRVLVRTPSDSD